MLKSLYIKNYVLIDELEVKFDSGFTVITGETGAGKSIILDALALILGQRADAQAIKVGETKCIIEAEFDVSGYNLQLFCEEHNIEYDAKAYIIRREIIDSGRSRAFINDSPVGLSDLKGLGEQLIDIHSQHQNLLLADESYQLNLLDAYAQNKDLCERYIKIFKLYRNTENALDKLKTTIEQSQQDEDYLKFQYEVLSNANLKDGEQEDLESELELLSHSELIKSSLYKVNSILSDDDYGVVVKLKEALSSISPLREIHKETQDIYDRLDSIYIDIKELNSDINRLEDNVEHNPQKLDETQLRLNEIYDLQNKFHVSRVSELVELCANFEEKLDSISSYSDQLEILNQDLQKYKVEVQALADELSKKRQKVAGEISQKLTLMAHELGMKTAKVSLKLESKTPDISGADYLEFLYAPGADLPLRPVAKIASGGEMSRLMLSLRTLVAGKMTLPTIIFDEIDTGVSGEVADKMGLMMHDLGKQMQIIAISHLPQIAAKGKSHFKIYKTFIDHKTQSNLKILSLDERVNEIASMLSGAKITDAAIENAKSMLEK